MTDRDNGVFFVWRLIKRNTEVEDTAGVSGLFIDWIGATSAYIHSGNDGNIFPAITNQPTDQRKDGKVDKLSEFVWILYNHYRRMYHSDELGLESVVELGEGSWNISAIAHPSPGFVVQLSNDSKSGL